jgi:hypothetical protein
MTAFLHDAAGASLPVAVGLLALAVAARGVLWAGIDHGPAQRVAERYLDPLALWCLVAVAVHTVALGAAGDADAFSFALPLALGVGAVLVRPARDVPEPTERTQRPERVDQPPVTAAPRTTPAPPTPAPAPAPDGRLWTDRGDDDRGRRTGLWSRA